MGFGNTMVAQRKRNIHNTYVPSGFMMFASRKQPMEIENSI